MLDIDAAQHQSLILSGVFKRLAQEVFSLEDQEAVDLQKKSIQVFHEILLQDHPSSIPTRAQSLHQSLENGLGKSILMLSCFDVGDKKQILIDQLTKEEKRTSKQLQDVIWNEDDNYDLYLLHKKTSIEQQRWTIKSSLNALQSSGSFDKNSFDYLLQSCNIDKNNALMQCMKSWCIKNSNEMLDMLGEPLLIEEMVIAPDPVDPEAIVEARDANHRKSKQVGP